MQKRQKRSSCTSIIIGKKASLDGSIIIGRNEDSKAAWPKHFVVHPHKKFITKQSFKSTDNNLELPLPQERFKYILPRQNGPMNLVFLKKMVLMNITLPCQLLKVHTVIKMY